MEPLQMNEKMVPELPHGWVWTTLGGILGFVKGKKPKNLGVKSELLTIPYINIKAFEQGVFNQFTDGDGCRLCKSDDILIVWDGARCGLVGRGVTGAIGSTLAKLDYYGLKSPYLFYFLQTQYERINTRPRGVGIPHVEPELFWNIPFPLPSLPEQHRIVTKIEELFVRLDAGVVALTNAKAQLKHYRQSVLKSACDGRLVPTEAELAHAEGRDYEPADVLLAHIGKERREKWEAEKKRKGKKSAKYKEPVAPDVSDLPELPEGWVWTRLDSLAELKGGITKDSKRVLTNARKIPYLRVANVQRGYLDLNEIKKIEAPESVISELLLKPGDILFTEGGDRDKLGRGCVWNGEIPECIHQNHIFRGRLYSNGASNKIISWFGNTFGQIYFMREGKQTTNLASINLTKLSAFPVPLPPLSEQHRIVVPQDPDDEPASVLLERIKAEKAKRGAEKKTKNKRKRKGDPKQKRLI